MTLQRNCLISHPEKDIDEFFLSFLLIETIFYSRKHVSGLSGVAFPNIWRSYFASPFRETPPHIADIYFRGTSFDRVLFILGPALHTLYVFQDPRSCVIPLDEIRFNLHLTPFYGEHLEF